MGSNIPTSSCKFVLSKRFHTTYFNVTTTEIFTKSNSRVQQSLLNSHVLWIMYLYFQNWLINTMYILTACVCPWNCDMQEVRKQTVKGIRYIYYHNTSLIGSAFTEVVSNVITSLWSSVIHYPNLLHTAYAIIGQPTIEIHECNHQFGGRSTAHVAHTCTCTYFQNMHIINTVHLPPWFLSMKLWHARGKKAKDERCKCICITFIIHDTSSFPFLYVYISLPIHRCTLYFLTTILLLLLHFLVFHACGLI